MSVDAFYFGWYLDDGALRFWHICTAGLDDWKAPPPWRLTGDGINRHPEPSLDCRRCGRHTILFASDEATPPDRDVVAHRLAMGGPSRATNEAT